MKLIYFWPIFNDMAKIILIPVDFCVASLNTLKLALDSFKEEKTEILLVYAEYLDDSITDLMFYSENRRIQTLLSQSSEFEEGLEIIKNRYHQNIHSITMKLIHSSNRNFLNKFLAGNNVEEIFIPKDYKFRLLKRAFDPVDLLKEIKLPVTEISWDTGYTQSEQEQLNALFN